MVNGLISQMVSLLKVKQKVLPILSDFILNISFKMRNESVKHIIEGVEN